MISQEHFSRRQLRHKKNKELISVTWTALAESHQLNLCWAKPFDGQTDIQWLSVWEFLRSTNCEENLIFLLSFPFYRDLIAEKLLWAITLIRVHCFCCSMHQHSTKLKSSRQSSACFMKHYLFLECEESYQFRVWTWFCLKSTAKLLIMAGSSQFTNLPNSPSLVWINEILLELPFGCGWNGTCLAAHQH